MPTVVLELDGSRSVEVLSVESEVGGRWKVADAGTMKELSSWGNEEKEEILGGTLAWPQATE